MHEQIDRVGIRADIADDLLSSQPLESDGRDDTTESRVVTSEILFVGTKAKIKMHFAVFRSQPIDLVWIDTNVREIDRWEDRFTRR